MATPVGPGVRVLSSPAEVAPGRGLALLPVRGAAHADGAAHAAGALAAGTRVGAARDRLRHARAEAAAARTAAAAATRLVPPVARGVEPAAVRLAGAAVVAARRSVSDAGSLGPRPELDGEAARRAHAAHAAVLEARADWRRGVGRVARLLTVANVAGVLLVAARLRTAAVDPAFVLVGVLPLAALAHAAVTAAVGVRRARGATGARRAALDAAGVASMAALAARVARADAWERRAARQVAAGARRADAERSWRALVGAGVDPADAAGVAAALVAAAGARVVLHEREAAWVIAALELQAAEDISAAAGR